MSQITWNLLKQAGRLIDQRRVLELNAWAKAISKLLDTKVEKGDIKQPYVDRRHLLGILKDNQRSESCKLEMILKHAVETDI